MRRTDTDGAVLRVRASSRIVDQATHLTVDRAIEDHLVLPFQLVKWEKHKKRNHKYICW